MGASNWGEVDFKRCGRQFGPKLNLYSIGRILLKYITSGIQLLLPPSYISYCLVRGDVGAEALCYMLLPRPLQSLIGIALT